MVEERREYCSCKLYIRGDDLDPHEVTSQLGVSPTESYRRGDQLRLGVTRESSGKGSQLIAPTGMWILHIDGEKKRLWDTSAQLEYWSDFLKVRQRSLYELQARGYETLIDCFVDEGPVVFIELSAAQLRMLGELGIALKIGVYDTEGLGNTSAT